MHQHRAHSHRRRVSAAISVAVLTAGLVTTLASGTAVAESIGPLYVGGASADDGGSCTEMKAPCATLQGALTKVATGDTIVLRDNLTVTAQVTVSTPGITIDGADHTITAAFPSGVNGENAVLGVFDSTGVSVHNLTVDGAGNNLLGIHAYRTSSLQLTSVAIRNAGRAGLLVNGSDVNATGLATEGNVWGSVEVDSGSGVEEPSKFSIDSTSVLGDKTQIWSDGNSSAPSTVDAIGYDVYYVKDNTGQEDLRIWAKGALTRPGAWFTGTDGVRDFYASLQSAIDNAPANGTVVIAGNLTTTAQVTVWKPGITINGGGHTISPSFSKSSDENNSVLGVRVDDVTIEDLTIDGADGLDEAHTYSKGLRGIIAYAAQGLTLNSVTIRNNETVGLLVIGSSVLANDLSTSGNGWGAVNVDPGAETTTPSEFALNIGNLAEDTQIWSDGDNVNATRTVVVHAAGFVQYNVHGDAHEKLVMWANKTLPKIGAYFAGENAREFYEDPSEAIDAASSGVVYVNPGDYPDTTITLDKTLTVEGAPASGRTWSNLKFSVTSPNPTILGESLGSVPSVAIHNFAFSGATEPIVTTDGPVVDARDNYWGSASPNFSEVVSESVTYSPWYIDSTMQVTINDETPRAQVDVTDEGTASADNIDTSGTNATATGTSGTVTLVALPTATAGSAVPSTGSSTTATKVVDLSVSNGAGISIITLTVCGVAGATNLSWYDGVEWRPVVPPASLADGCLTATFDDTDSSPSISDLTGTVFAAVKRVSTPGGGAGGSGAGDGAGSTTPPSGSTSRIAGSNRYATAALIAEQFIKADAAYSGAVVLANGENFKQGLDALSANYLAGAQHAPILLTQAGTLPAATVAGLRAVLTGQAGATIYVMGGVDSVSDAAVAQAKKIAETVTGGTVTVKRIAGADRYATSAASATSSGSVGTVIFGSGTGMKTVILASGEVNADALAAGSLSFAAHLPVLLTQAGSLPQSVQAAITKLGVKQVIVLGGTDRVSAAVVKSLAAIGVTSVTRIAGTDRFDTAARIYRFARSNVSVGMDGSAVYLANGITGFPDALAVGPLAGATSSSVLTVTGTSLPGSTAKFLTSYKASVTSVVPLGASATVAQSVVDAATAALG